MVELYFQDVQTVRSQSKLKTGGSVVYGNIRDNERLLCHELNDCVRDCVKRAACAQALLDVESECSN
jgi:hypothetical protein